MAAIKRKVTATIQPNQKKNIAAERKVEFELSYGETIEDYVSLYGAQVVKDLIEDQLTVKAQARARLYLEKGRTDLEIQSALSVWSPGSRENVDARSALQAQLAGLTPAQQREFLETIAEQYGYSVA